MPLRHLDPTAPRGLLHRRDVRLVTTPPATWLSRRTAGGRTIPSLELVGR